MEGRSAGGEREREGTGTVSASEGRKGEKKRTVLYYLGAATCEILRANTGGRAIVDALDELLIRARKGQRVSGRPSSS